MTAKEVKKKSIKSKDRNVPRKEKKLFVKNEHIVYSGCCGLR